ncbi:MAG TPA: glycosyltransferase [Candidatus Binataceae bacterium]|nr:glycosyltransferase [Candidatus Binataceae bacterium]
MSSRGGGNAVAAWALQALREEFEVTLAALAPPDYPAVNDSFGTSLGPNDFTVRIAPRSYRVAIGCLPTPGALMEACVMMRWAQELDRRERFDVILSTQNEADFHRPSIQYVHFPWSYLPRPENELRWYHRIPGALALYRGSCARLAHCSDAGMRGNLSLANSSFVADRIKKVHGVDSLILHPPVPGNFPQIPWQQKLPSVVAVGRMNGCKRWEDAVEIVERVRSRGIGLGLTLISHQDDVEYGRRIAALAASRPWFRIRSELSREELVAEVTRHRYGIHTMVDEHFGIAVAELLRAGCVTFVHNSGGPVEIVGNRAELTFNDTGEAAEKIAATILDRAREESLRSFIESRREEFSTERFCAGLVDVVRNFKEIPQAQVVPLAS